MYVTIRSWMSLIMDLIKPELSELFALEFAKNIESNFVYTHGPLVCSIDLKFGQNVCLDDFFDEYKFRSPGLIN